ncbi:peptide ABC transporter substrate-binding protein [Sulfobacillus thermosulfidooxidans]|uniref:peptide ABC transporter substrate-binding protein n=1 Tax=Sulfobacillus thermosulfidooxidans TaxID=28034 RepID=UPI000415C8CF|nr:peptide ABC transporter substrate-binding protein [Sulfobacillus thermosulfidooxidans]
MQRRLALMSAVGLIGVTALAGCGTSNASSSTHSHTGGTVVVAEAPQTPPNWFFPVFSSSAYTEINAQIQFLMYRPLIYLNKENQVDYSRSLVSKIQVNPQDNVFTLTLNHKYKWSDGKPITAQDVVFTWDLMDAASQPNSPWPYGPAGSGGVPKDWKSVTADGPNTVVITLDKSVNPAWFIHNGLGQISPVPEFVWNKYPNNMTQELKFIQSVSNEPTNPLYDVVDGPFKFAKWAPNQYWELVPNPNFGGHKASISKLIFQYETSSADEFAGLKNGQVNVGYLPPSLWSTRNQLTNDTLSQSYLFGFNYIILNFNKQAPNGMGPIFSKLYVRQALQMGINQQGLIDSMYHGAGVPEDGPIPSKPYTAFYDTALNNNPYPFNPQAGKKLLEEHGWHEVNGVMTKNGQKLAFTFTYASASTTLSHVAQLLQSDWAKEGIQVTLQQLPINQLFADDSQSSPSKWNMGYWGAGWTYQLDYYPTGGNLFATGAGENSGGYSNPTLDQLIQATYEPGTPQQIQSRMDAYQEFMAKHLPVLWMPWFPQGYARMTGFAVHSNNVHGTVSTFNPVTDFLYANYWTVSN